MLCRLGKSLSLIFYFAKTRKDEFSLRYERFEPKSVIRISQCCMAVRNPNDRFGFKFYHILLSLPLSSTFPYMRSGGACFRGFDTWGYTLFREVMQVYIHLLSTVYIHLYSTVYIHLLSTVYIHLYSTVLYTYIRQCYTLL